MTTTIRGSFVVVLAVSLFSDSCSSSRKSSAADSTMVPASRTAVIARYNLISIAGQPLPSRYDGGAIECTETVFAGRYELSDSTWSSKDSVARKCPPTLSRLERWDGTGHGVIRRNMDTLLFNTVDSSGREIPIDRGIRRRDSLFTRGGQWGDDRVYVLAKPRRR